MNQLKTSPVVVIDDAPEEALPILKAMGRLGVGCAYIPGDRFEELPKPPIPGVRVVFMDMQLGTEGDSRKIGTQAATVFIHTIDAGTVPIVIVLWTKHEEHVEEFRKALFEMEPRFQNGCIIVRLEKPQDVAQMDVEALSRSISAIVDQMSPLRFLWFWEQVAHDAATQTSGALGKLVAADLKLKESATDEERQVAWCDGMRYILRCLVHVASGQNIDPNTACRDLLEVFAQLHQDRLEHEAIGGIIARLDDVLGLEWNAPSLDMRTAINTMLLISPVDPKDDSIRPGSIYLPDEDLGEKCLHKLCCVDAAAIARELLQLTKDKEYEKDWKVYEQKRNRNHAGCEVAEIEARMEGRFRQIVGECVPLLLEISPGCDYAQCNRKVSRFIGGMLIPDRWSSLIFGRKDSILHAPAVRLPGKEGSWHPVFSGRFPYTLPNPKSAIWSQPICRLRSPFLISILHWCAVQASRPDFLSL